MIYEPQAYTTEFINHANHRRVILTIARILVAIAYVNTHWQCCLLYTSDAADE